MRKDNRKANGIVIMMDAVLNGSLADNDRMVPLNILFSLFLAQLHQFLA